MDEFGKNYHSIFIVGLDFFEIIEKMVFDKNVFFIKYEKQIFNNFYLKNVFRKTFSLNFGKIFFVILKIKH